MIGFIHRKHINDDPLLVRQLGLTVILVIFQCRSPAYWVLLRRYIMLKLKRIEIVTR